jgi:hypothetical protein
VARDDGSVAWQMIRQMAVAVIDDVKQIEFSALPAEPQRIQQIPVQRALRIESRFAALERAESR